MLKFLMGMLVATFINVLIALKIVDILSKNDRVQVAVKTLIGDAVSEFLFDEDKQPRTPPRSYNQFK